MRCKNKKCNQLHDGSFGGGNYCSRGCANSRIKTDEVKKKHSESMKRAFAEGRAKRPQLNKQQLIEVIEKRKRNWENALLETDFSSLTFERIRKRIILEQEGKCNNCKLDVWCNEPIMLELEHKDGNNQNNTRDNLEMLCPNCHSLTATWRGRNKTSENKRRSIPDEEVIKAFVETGNIRQCLLKLGLAAKGANYGRVKRALTLWGIEY